ncbi:phage tail assembly protein [Tumebacillus permanentifrigoris]|uniref:Tail assembly chaperone E/41/14-like protein n=1 Tax=Tumebacillus permanentifrigoris TaxID=378543 RepID=A0A316DES0_9BACL|nr:phage tail assembly protein [Tumebacillus permanentifrigoris]PWK16062.1 tail assembly chaperone E/41/14-like protein [Tumebacillus permanentifrigoris]
MSEKNTEKTYQFSKSIKFEGVDYSEIVLDFDKLTGDDILKAESQYLATGGASHAPREMSKTYLVIVAARAAGVPVELFNALPAKDFSKITVRTQGFLLQ